MGRSQRHLVWEHGSSAAGEIHAQGVVAPGIAMQVDPVALNVLKAGPPLYNAGMELKSPRVDLVDVVVPEGSPGGPLQGSSLTGAIPEELVPDPAPPRPDPVPGEEPVLNSINPSTAHMGSADVTMHVNGEKFTDTSLIYFNSGAETTTFNNVGQLQTIVKPSLVGAPIDVPVWVQQGSYKTSEKTFTFTDPLDEGHRTLPAGPFNISHIEDHADGIAMELADGDVHVGDSVLIEATSNTGINGNYTVLSVDGLTIVVDNMVVLDTPIDDKGRLTVNGEA